MCVDTSCCKYVKDELLQICVWNELLKMCVWWYGIKWRHVSLVWKIHTYFQQLVIIHTYLQQLVLTHICLHHQHTFKLPMWATVNYSMVVLSLHQYMYIYIYIYIPQLVDLHYNIYDKKTHVGPTLLNLSTTLYTTIYRTVLKYISLIHLHLKVPLTTKLIWH